MLPRARVHVAFECARLVHTITSPTCPDIGATYQKHRRPAFAHPPRDAEPELWYAVVFIDTTGVVLVIGSTPCRSDEPNSSACACCVCLPSFRMMILEKAYAKFCNSRLGYQALDGGLVHDGMVAFTGGASEEIFLDDAQPGVLWKRLLHYKVGCAAASVSCAAIAARGFVSD